MGVSDEAKNVIPLKFLRKIKNKNVFPLVNSIRGHTVYFKFIHFIGRKMSSQKKRTLISAKEKVSVVNCYNEIKYNKTKHT
jgi:hypothetical protein